MRSFSGGKCGGTFVDRNLYALMTKRFGTAFTSLDPEQNGPGSQFMDTFEHKKRDFSMKNPSTKAIKIHLPMPALSSDSNLDQYYNRRLSYVLLSHDDMKSLFDPVVEMILKLVDDQVAQVKRVKAAPIDTLILIGGFGASPYLRQRLQEWCAKSNIRLTTPWSGA
jgi:tRNA A37 threonylcarbamoyltransferase TsaD